MLTIVYEVQKVLARRPVKRKGRAWEYLIGWKGFGPEGDTWEAEGDVFPRHFITSYNNSWSLPVCTDRCATWENEKYIRAPCIYIAEKYGKVIATPLYKELFDQAKERCKQVEKEAAEAAKCKWHHLISLNMIDRFCNYYGDGYGDGWKKYIDVDGKVIKYTKGQVGHASCEQTTLTPADCKC